MASEISISQTNYFRDNRRTDKWERNKHYILSYWAVRTWGIFVTNVCKFLDKVEVHKLSKEKERGQCPTILTEKLGQ